ncbi:RING-H2 finger protein ATL47-like isoform X2 [Malania oleifera]|uniref:RING-H2 finger protein ATL47-like isoform X2 n=1 Tax=Malania oleifera TaxID=397392 RepID=UPI0025AE79C1|nr:RING-H2 finger protein ATL47-like isoform X2 [Malania oleifera]
MKRSSSSPIYQSNRNPDASGSLALQRQLQQLFRLHDSGLDQASIDALPVFFYKDIMGLKEPFDCAVCLCEFSEDDKLRLLPLCSHAFHTYCIDTWLLSNSTCPLCRGTLFSSALPLANPLFSSDSTEIPNGLPSESDGENGFSCTMKPGGVTEEVSGQKKVFPVRLGKFRSVNDRGDSVERGQGESSSCNLDARRCFSLGSFRYVVGDSNLRVALSEGMSDGRDAKLVKGGGQNASSAGDSDHVESCRKISSSKGPSSSRH